MAAAAAKTSLQDLSDRAHELAEADPAQSARLYKQVALAGASLPRAAMEERPSSECLWPRNHEKPAGWQRELE